MAWAVTVPDRLEMIVGEQLNLAVNFTQEIAAGDVLSAPTAVITNEATNEIITAAIIGSPSISNSVIMNLTVTSAPLRPSAKYVLALTCTATGGGQSKKLSALMTIKVIY